MSATNDSTGRELSRQDERRADATSSGDAEFRPATGPHRLRRSRLAILYADVAGYSRLMDEDEEATHHVVDRYLDIFSAHVLANGGTVCHYAGDAILASFPGSGQAIACAIDAQQEFARRNRRARGRPQVQFRVGLNVADVIVSRGEVFGTGVNVAARLQALAEPGGVCLSDDVRREARDDLGLTLVDLGCCSLKNIETRVRAWRFDAPCDLTPRSSRPSASRTSSLAAALNDWVSRHPAGPPRRRIDDQPGAVGALYNLRLVESGSGSLAIEGQVGPGGKGARLVSIDVGTDGRDDEDDSDVAGRLAPRDFNPQRVDRARRGTS